MYNQTYLPHTFANAMLTPNKASDGASVATARSVTRSFELRGVQFQSSVMQHVSIARTHKLFFHTPVIIHKSQRKKQILYLVWINLMPWAPVAANSAFLRQHLHSPPRLLGLRFA